MIRIELGHWATEALPSPCWKTLKVQAKWEQELHKPPGVISSLTLVHNMPWICLAKPYCIEEGYENEEGQQVPWLHNQNQMDASTECSWQVKNTITACNYVSLIKLKWKSHSNYEYFPASFLTLRQCYMLASSLLLKLPSAQSNAVHLSHPWSMDPATQQLLVWETGSLGVQGSLREWPELQAALSQGLHRTRDCASSHYQLLHSHDLVL